MKQGPNTVKHGQNEVKTRSNGRVNLKKRYKPAWDLKYGCVLTPLGSPTTGLKRSYVHVRRAPARTRQCVRHRSVGGCTTGVWDRWVGGGGAIPVHPPSCSRRVPQTAERARKACRAWSGGLWEPDAQCAQSQDPPLRGPVGPILGPPWSWPCLAPLLTNKGEIPSIIQ